MTKQYQQIIPLLKHNGYGWGKCFHYLLPVLQYSLVCVCFLESYLVLERKRFACSLSFVSLILWISNICLRWLFEIHLADLLWCHYVRWSLISKEFSRTEAPFWGMMGITACQWWAGLWLDHIVHAAGRRLEKLLHLYLYGVISYTLKRWQENLVGAPFI